MSSNSNRKTITTLEQTEKEVDVLYQKLGDKWFAFSVINDEVFMSSISEEQMIEIRNENEITPHIPNYEAT